MLKCAEQLQLQKYKTYAYKTLKTASVQSCSKIELNSKDGSLFVCLFVCLFVFFVFVFVFFS